jgi:DNA (cytosine-5)-methyltransferase 1
VSAGDGRSEAGGPSALLVDFFSGCGGTSQGFLQAGAEVGAAIDNDPVAAATFSRNFPRAAVLCRDIRDVTTAELAAVLGVRGRDQRSLIFSACAPCQPFSRQRRGGGDADDRRDLLAELLPFVGAFRPEALFVENVPGLQHRAADYGPLTRFVRSVRARGYRVSYAVVESRQFGVPQVRQRLVLLASRLGPVGFPVPTHGPQAGRPYATVRDAINHLPPLAAGGAHPDDSAHRASRLSELNLARIRATAEGAGHESWPPELVLPCHVGKGRTFSDAYGRLRWDAPAPALTTRCISYSNGRYGHPEQDRGLSAREAARLQTFPDSFRFEGSLESMARQIGNAVPVVLAREFARVLLRHLDEARAASA